MNLNLSPGFNLALARACADAAAKAYESATFETARAHALAVEHDNAFILAIRGTQHAHDWMTDARFGLVETQFGPVHHGFWDMASELVIALADWHPGKPVVLTGHSLGGGVALPLARLLILRLEIPAIYTLGQPRVGNSEWRTKFDAVLGPRTFRVVNQLDIVPRLPGILAGYRHTRNIALLAPTGLPILQPNLGLLLTWDLQAMWNDLLRDRHVGLLADHPIAHYQARLQPGLEEVNCVK